MRALVVVEMEVAIQCLKQLRTVGEVAWVDELVLETAPQALDEYVVQGAASSVHADQDTALLQRRQKIRRRELRTLIGVPDFGLAEDECSLQRRQTEPGLHGVGESQLSTKRLNQSMIATRYRKPLCIGR